MTDMNMKGESCHKVLPREYPERGEGGLSTLGFQRSMLQLEMHWARKQAHKWLPENWENPSLISSRSATHGHAILTHMIRPLYWFHLVGVVWVPNLHSHTVSARAKLERHSETTLSNVLRIASATGLFKTILVEENP